MSLDYFFEAVRDLADSAVGKSESEQRLELQKLIDYARSVMGSDEFGY